MFDKLLIYGGILMILMIGSMIWLIIENLKLKHNYQRLLGYIVRINQDIAGLCSAAVNVDSRLSSNGDQLKNLAHQVTEYAQHEIPPQPYHSVIQKVRGGAQVNELMQEYGLSRDEASLLISLHASHDERD